MTNLDRFDIHYHSKVGDLVCILIFSEIFWRNWALQRLEEAYLSRVILLFELLSSSGILDNTNKWHLWNKPWPHEMRNNRVEGRSQAIYKFCTFLSLLIFLPAFHYGKHLPVFLIICLGAMVSDFFLSILQLLVGWEETVILRVSLI